MSTAVHETITLPAGEVEEFPCLPIDILGECAEHEPELVVDLSELDEGWL